MKKLFLMMLLAAFLGQAGALGFGSVTAYAGTTIIKATTTIAKVALETTTTASRQTRAPGHPGARELTMYPLRSAERAKPLGHPILPLHFSYLSRSKSFCALSVL